MQITLNQDEINAAVEGYVRSQINLAENQDIKIDFTAGRGPNGISATLDIRPAAMTSSRTRAAEPTFAKTPAAAAKAQPQESQEEAAPPVEEEEASGVEENDVAQADEEEAPAPAPKKAGALFGKKTAASTDNDDQQAGEEEPAERPRPKSVFSKAG